MEMRPFATLAGEADVQALPAVLPPRLKEMVVLGVSDGEAEERSAEEHWVPREARATV